MPQVEIPRRYRGPTGGAANVEVSGESVRACIEAVEARHPGFLELVVDADGSLHRFVSIFVNDEELPRDALDIAVAGPDRISIAAAAAGG
ncbi:MAG: MoaD/ThiS family protein [Myxococcales bacterium]|nr:MoaD/ThiS family protein [Myxococcales bacterium]